jgi:hypothetical protein
LLDTPSRRSKWAFYWLDGLGMLTSFIVLDRTEGLRTAPRDALISLSSPPEGLATALVCTERSTLPGRCLARWSLLGLALAPGAFDAILSSASAWR